MRNLVNWLQETGRARIKQIFILSVQHSSSVWKIIGAIAAMVVGYVVWIVWHKKSDLPLIKDERVNTATPVPVTETVAVTEKPKSDAETRFEKTVYDTLNQAWKEFCKLPDETDRTRPEQIRQILRETEHSITVEVAKEVNQENSFLPLEGDGLHEYMERLLSRWKPEGVSTAVGAALVLSVQLIALLARFKEFSEKIIAHVCERFEYIQTSIDSPIWFDKCLIKKLAFLKDGDKFYIEKSGRFSGLSAWIVTLFHTESFWREMNENEENTPQPVTQIMMRLIQEKYRMESGAPNLRSTVQDYMSFSKTFFGAIEKRLDETLSQDCALVQISKVIEKTQKKALTWSEFVEQIRNNLQTEIPDSIQSVYALIKQYDDSVPTQYWAEQIALRWVMNALDQYWNIRKDDILEGLLPPVFEETRNEVVERLRSNVARLRSNLVTKDILLCTHSPHHLAILSLHNVLILVPKGVVDLCLWRRYQDWTFNSQRVDGDSKVLSETTFLLRQFPAMQEMSALRLTHTTTVSPLGEGADVKMASEDSMTSRSSGSNVAGPSLGTRYIA